MLEGANLRRYKNTGTLAIAFLIAGECLVVIGGILIVVGGAISGLAFPLLYLGVVFLIVCGICKFEQRRLLKELREKEAKDQMVAEGMETVADEQEKNEKSDINAKYSEAYEPLRAVDRNVRHEDVSSLRRISSFRDFCADLEKYLGENGAEADATTLRRLIAAFATYRLFFLPDDDRSKAFLQLLAGFFKGDMSIVPPAKGAQGALLMRREEDGKQIATPFAVKLYTASICTEVFSLPALCVKTRGDANRIFSDFEAYLGKVVTDGKPELVPFAPVAGKTAHAVKDGCIRLYDNVRFFCLVAPEDMSSNFHLMIDNYSLDLSAMRTSCKAKTVTSGAGYLAESFYDAVEKSIRDNPLPEEFWRKLDGVDAFLVQHTGKHIDNRFWRQLECYLPVYIACGGGINDGFDFLFSQCILRSLFKKEITSGAEREELATLLGQLFGVEALPECIALLNRKGE